MRKEEMTMGTIIGKCIVVILFLPLIVSAIIIFGALYLYVECGEDARRRGHTVLPPE